MKKETTIIQSITYVVLGTAAILTLPLIGMQLNAEINWTLSDFIIMGVLLLSTGLTYVFLSRKFSKNKLIVGFLIAGIFFYLWAELAVGIFTNWGS